MDCGELVEWARCRSMNPGRELASCLEPPRAMGFDNEQRSKMGDAMPTDLLGV